MSPKSLHIFTTLSLSSTTRKISNFGALKTKIPSAKFWIDLKLGENDTSKSKSVIEKSDGLVTYHGTSAIEFAAMGKPVMVTDKGWYHDCGFVKFPKSKKEYLKNS